LVSKLSTLPLVFYALRQLLLLGSELPVQLLGLRLQLLVKSGLLGRYLVLGVYLRTAAGNPRAPQRDRRGHDRATAGQQGRLPGCQLLPRLETTEQHRHPHNHDDDEADDEQSHRAGARPAAVIGWPGAVIHTADYRPPPHARTRFDRAERSMGQRRRRHVGRWL
jgi:hypothetical protein